MLVVSVAFLIAAAFVNAEDFNPEQVKFGVEVTDVSTVKFYWNPIIDTFGALYVIFCKVDSFTTYFVYSGRNLNYTTVGMRPFVEHNCILLPCPGDESRCPHDEDISVTFFNIAPERLKPTRDFTVLRKNESTVQFKWDDIITPYMGEYLLSCSVEGSMTNPDLLQRLNSTSFLWNAPKSIEIYSCVLNVCWKGIFHGEMQEYCPTETKSFIRFNVSSLVTQPPDSSPNSALACSLISSSLIFLLAVLMSN